MRNLQIPIPKDCQICEQRCLNDDNRQAKQALHHFGEPLQ